MLYMIAPRFIYSITGNFVPSGPLHVFRPLPPPSASGITDAPADELCLRCFPRFHTWGHTAFVFLRLTYLASQVMLVVKNPPASAGDTREEGSIPQSGRPSGEGNGNPLRYSCLENPMDEGPGGLQAGGWATEARLTYFTQHKALNVLPCCCKWRDFFFFNGWIRFHCVCVWTYVDIKYHIFFIHSCPSVLLSQFLTVFHWEHLPRELTHRFKALGCAFLMGCHNCRIAGKKRVPTIYDFVF